MTELLIIQLNYVADSAISTLEPPTLYAHVDHVAVVTLATLHRAP